MADLTLNRWPGEALDRNIAIAASVVVHVLVFLALFSKFGTPPDYPPTPVMNVELAPPWSRKLPRPAPVPPVSTKPERAQAAANLPVLSQPAPTPDIAGAVPKPRETTDEALPLRNALRARGCDHAALLGLSRAEREACLDRLAKAHPGIDPYRLNLDKRGDYAAAKNPVPYLARKPHDGCKMGAGGDTAPSGQQGAAGGIACAWSF